MNRCTRTILAAIVAALLAVPAFAADTLKVGVQAPITGSYANEGQGIENGTRLLAEQINANGGVMGKQIEVIACDDQGTAMAASRAPGTSPAMRARRRCGESRGQSVPGRQSRPRARRPCSCFPAPPRGWRRAGDAKPGSAGTGRQPGR